MIHIKPKPNLEPLLGDVTWIKNNQFGAKQPAQRRLLSRNNPMPPDAMKRVTARRIKTKNVKNDADTSYNQRSNVIAPPWALEQSNERHQSTLTERRISEARS